MGNRTTRKNGSKIKLENEIRDERFVGDLTSSPGYTKCGENQ
jgi:hypothetical protein